MKQYIQGDVCLIEHSLDKQLKKIGNSTKVLVRGEKTGHSHIMKGDVNFYENGNGTVLCQVMGEGAVLQHEEHELINVPRGDYIVVRQQEYNVVDGIRRVQD
jgi:hypothetical protein